MSGDAAGRTRRARRGPGVVRRRCPPRRCGCGGRRPPVGGGLRLEIECYSGRAHAEPGRSGTGSTGYQGYGTRRMDAERERVHRRDRRGTRTCGTGSRRCSEAAGGGSASDHGHERAVGGRAGDDEELRRGAGPGGGLRGGRAMCARTPAGRWRSEVTLSRKADQHGGGAATKTIDGTATAPDDYLHESGARWCSAGDQMDLEDRGGRGGERRRRGRWGEA